MFAYIIRRLLLIIPTLLGILVINFIIIQVAPGGPVEQMIANLKGLDTGVQSQLGGGNDLTSSTTTSTTASNSPYLGAQGLRPELIAEIEKLYGFDKPAYERFFIMLKNFLTFDFGESFFRDKTVIDLIIEKIPVSLSIGIWTTLLTYLISIPLGIKKAVNNGSKFDIWTSVVIIVGNAIPSFLFAILLIVLFAGGNYFSWFPLRGLTSNDFDMLPWYEKILDYLWHMVLPITAMTISGFATLTLLTKNYFLGEISKQYVRTARAKGLTEKKILYRHVFRNAMLIIIAGFPAALIRIFFTGALLIEVIFSLDGLGLLSFESAINRDYPVIFANLYIFTLIGLLLKLISDITYMIIDPRIDFESREG